MKNYRNIIINHLLDRYENSAYFKDSSKQQRKITLHLRKLFKEYGNSKHYIETETIENEIEYLLNNHFVVIDQDDGFGKKSIKLVLDDEIIKKMYDEVNRSYQKDKTQELICYIDSLNYESFIQEFLCYLNEQLIHHKSLTPYLKSYDINELKNTINILSAMLNQDEEISFRKFSVAVLHDSKLLNNYKSNIYKIIKDFYDNNIENDKQAFETFNIVTNPSYIYIKGNITFSINNQIINLSELNYQFALSNKHISHMNIIDIKANKVMTVENLTSFYDLELDDTLIVYLGGFHNTLRRKFIIKIYEFLKENVEYYHFGDIDAGGFYIYLDLIKKTNIPFKRYKMDLETLVIYKSYCKSLTVNDRKRLMNLKDVFKDDVIDYMLENNIKLEQEIIDV